MHSVTSSWGPARRWILLLSFIFVLPQHSLKAQSLAGVSGFSKVDDHVYRGGQPNSDGLHSLAKQGIRTILDLRGANGRSDEERRIAESLGMRYVSVPMPSLSAPSDAMVAEALATLDDSTAWPVFVHCRRGKDRTGVVVACYRISRTGWNSAAALEEAREKGLSSVEVAMKRYILRYPSRAEVSTSAAGESAQR